MTEEEMTAKIASLEASITKLESKNSELIDREKAAKTRADAAEAAAQEAADNAKAENGTELEKANRAIAKLNKDLEAANQRADESNKSYRTYRATAALNEAISANNVDSIHAGVLSRAFKHDIAFNDEGEPTIEGKAVDAYFKTYFSKDGLRYVRADQNSAGLSQGHDGAKGTTWTKMPSTSTEWQEFDKMPVAERNAVCDQNGWDALKL